MANKIIPDIGIHHLALYAVDFDKSVKFYTEGLGFEKVTEWGEGAGRIMLLDIGNGSCFEIFAKANLGEEKDARFWHFAFSTDDPDGAYAKAIAAGAVSHMEPKDVDIPSNPVFPVRIAFVKGPDGELLEFFQVKK